MSKFFWDTNLFIYQSEANPTWEPKVSALVSYQEIQSISIVTSSLTMGEVLVKPTKDSRKDLVLAYETVFATSNVFLLVRMWLDNLPFFVQIMA